MFHRFIDTHPRFVRALIALAALTMLMISAGAPRIPGG